MPVQKKVTAQLSRDGLIGPAARLAIKKAGRCEEPADRSRRRVRARGVKPTLNCVLTSINTPKLRIIISKFSHLCLFVLFILLNV